jgi:hypothetical protein
MVKPRQPGRAASETGHRFAKPTSGRPACKSGTMLAGQHAAGLVIPAEATPSKSLGDPARVAIPCGSEPPAGHKRHRPMPLLLVAIPGYHPRRHANSTCHRPVERVPHLMRRAPAQRSARSDCGAGTSAEARDPPAPQASRPAGERNPESCFDLGGWRRRSAVDRAGQDHRHRLGARGSGGPRGRGCRRPNALIDRAWWSAGRLGSR